MMETVSASEVLSQAIAMLTTEVETLAAALSEKKRALRALTRAAGSLLEGAPASDVRETQYEPAFVESVRD